MWIIWDCLHDFMVQIGMTMMRMIKTTVPTSAANLQALARRMSASLRLSSAS